MPAYVPIIDVLLQRLAVIAVNHFNKPYRDAEGVWHMSEYRYLCIARNSA